MREEGAVGGGRGWGLAVTDGPDAVECFRKGGPRSAGTALTTGFGAPLTAAGSCRKLPSLLPPRPGAPVVGERRRPVPGRGGQPERGSRRSVFSLLSRQSPAGGGRGGSVRLRSAR